MNFFKKIWCRNLSIKSLLLNLQKSVIPQIKAKCLNIKIKAPNVLDHCHNWSKYPLKVSCPLFSKIPQVGPTNVLLTSPSLKLQSSTAHQINQEDLCFPKVPDSTLGIEHFSPKIAIPPFFRNRGSI